MAKIKVTLVRSGHGHTHFQKRVLESLGLRRRTRSVIHEDCGSIRGMIIKANHLVKVEEIAG